MEQRVLHRIDHFRSDNNIHRFEGPRERLSPILDNVLRLGRRRSRVPFICFGWIPYQILLFYVPPPLCAPRAFLHLLSGHRRRRCHKIKENVITNKHADSQNVMIKDCKEEQQHHHHSF